MKTLRVLALVLFVVFYGTPLPVQANSPEVFDLPDGHVGESYQTDIEAVLRDKYRLKIETGVRDSILQWALVEGELPPGLAVRTDGKIGGTPDTYKEQAYYFRVKVIDMAVNSADGLLIPLRLSIRPSRLRLTSISSPNLAPISGQRSATPDDTTVTANGERVSVASGAAESAEREVPSIPLSRNHHNPSENPTVLAKRPKSGSMISRVVGFFGLGRANGGTAPDDDDDSTPGCSSAHNKVTSDEAHTPLEGDTSTQKTCVRFINLNPIKYRYEFNEKRTTTAGPDISSLPFLPKITPTTPSAVSSATSGPPSPASPVVAAFKIRTREENNEKAAKKLGDELELLNDRFNRIKTDLNTEENSLRTTVEDPINQMVTAVQNAHKRSIRLANSADVYLQSNNISNLLAEVTTVKGEIDTALNNDWPSAAIATVQRDLELLQTSLEDIRFDNGGNQDVSQEAWAEWLAANQDRYTRVRDRITELKNKVTGINAGASAFNDSKNVLAEWQLIIDNVKSLGEAAFKQNVLVSCHTDEGENQSSKLSISKTDRTVANQAAITREVLTVNCYSRVAITGGFNFSTLDEKEFSVVQSAGTTPGTVVKKFGFTTNSSFRPNPLALINLRFTDRPVYNWHASFGAVVDLKGQTGTDVEPVAGISFSIRRLMFITPFAIHFGRVTKLAGDFKIGDPVPDAVATPPIEKAWKIGYTAGVTFRIAPQ